MGIICRKYKRKEPDTAFCLDGTRRVICRLDAKLSPDDWEAIHSLFNFIYRQGEEAGDAKRAAIIREALGFEEGTNNASM